MLKHEGDMQIHKTSTHLNNNQSHLANIKCSSANIVGLEMRDWRQMCSPDPAVQSADATLPGWAESAPVCSAPKSFGLLCSHRGVWKAQTPAEGSQNK